MLSGHLHHYWVDRYFHLQAPRGQLLAELCPTPRGDLFQLDGHLNAETPSTPAQMKVCLPAGSWAQPLLVVICQIYHWWPM